MANRVNCSSDSNIWAFSLAAVLMMPIATLISYFLFWRSLIDTDKTGPSLNEFIPFAILNIRKC
jgi:hypothetical protein